MKKYRPSLVSLCSLVLLSTALAAPVVPGELMNPRDTVVKAISPTPAQIKKLDALKATMEKTMDTTLNGVGERYIKQVMALSETPKYKVQLEAAAGAPEAEREAATQKIWDAMNEEVRPTLEKELFTLLRGQVVVYFDGVAKFTTAQQKPKLAKARAAVLANFDKELPATLRQLTADLKVDKDSKGDKSSKG